MDEGDNSVLIGVQNLNVAVEFEEMSCNFILKVVDFSHLFDCLTSLDEFAFGLQKFQNTLLFMFGFFRKGQEKVADHSSCFGLQFLTKIEFV